MNKTVKLIYVTDVLCIWAYLAQIRLDELRSNFGEAVQVEQRFISVFGDTEDRIGKGWQEQGGYTGFSDHLLEVATKFPHIKVSPEVWRSCRPATSMTSHLFLKAVELLVEGGDLSNEVNTETGRSPVEEMIWKVRVAFFEQALDIGKLSVLMGLAEQMDLPVTLLEDRLTDGSAMAALSTDMDLKQEFKLEGSPSFILNEGRQKLFGNVGYRIIQANVVELLEQQDDQASWC